MLPEQVDKDFTECLLQQLRLRMKETWRSFYHLTKAPGAVPCRVRPPCPTMRKERNLGGAGPAVLYRKNILNINIEHILPSILLYLLYNMQCNHSYRKKSKCNHGAHCFTLIFTQRLLLDSTVGYFYASQRSAPAKFI